jgi:hypothetical protein
LLGTLAHHQRRPSQWVQQHLRLLLLLLLTLLVLQPGLQETPPAAAAAAAAAAAGAHQRWVPVQQVLLLQASPAWLVLLASAQAPQRDQTL